MSLDPVYIFVQIEEQQKLSSQITTKVYSAANVNDTLKLDTSFITTLTLLVTIGDFC